MKNYKFVVPIVLVVLFFVSVYSLYSQKAEIENQYNSLIKEARELKQQEIYVDAEEKYLEALEVKESKDLYLEIGKFYVDSDQKNRAADWGENILQKYPKEKFGYEYLIDIYVTQKDYASCWSVYNKQQKRKVNSSVTDEIMQSIEGEFYFSEESEDVGVFSAGYCPVMLEGQWGFVDESGKIVVPIKFKQVSAFSPRNLAAVIDNENKVYFIDAEGNKKIAVKNIDNVKEIGYIWENVFSVYNGREWSFYNVNSEKVFGGFEEVTSLANGVVACSKNHKWDFYDTEGKKLSDGNFDSVITDERNIVFRNECAFVSKNGKVHMVNAQGKDISNEYYEEAELFNDSTYAAVKINGLWGFVDNHGSIIIKPEYEEARSFSNGLAAVKKNGLWGFVDTENKMIIEPQFYGAKDFNSKGSVFVYENNIWKLLNLYKYNY